MKDIGQERELLLFRVILIVFFILLICATALLYFGYIMSALAIALGMAIVVFITRDESE